MSVNPQLMGLINQYAQRFNLDPRAVAAVSMMEGGGRFGAIGDHGTSGGPFQLHIGGALPQGKSLAWASTPAGIRYAMRLMAQNGAAGKSGRAAISAIVSNFERPADPTSEIAGALARYGGIQGGGGAPMARGTGSHGPAMAQRQGQSRLQMLMANNQQFMTTGRIDPLLQQSAMQNGLTNADQAQLGNIRPGMGQSIPGKVGSIVQMARSFANKNIPYVWGGTTPKGFDCSGLVQYLYAKAGINLPRTTYQQINSGRKVGWGQFRPGDLIFSDFEGTGKPTHVVMYIGNGKVIAAPHTGDHVRIEDVSLFKSNFIGARRIVH